MNQEQFKQIFSQISQGQLQESEIVEFLDQTGLDQNALIAAAEVFYQAKLKLPKIEGDIIDICGTGGDGLNSLNISTAVAFVLAGAGVRVAKHGNKAVTSKSGSSDILAQLGVNIMLEPEKVQQSLLKNNLGFFFAPLYHPAFKYVGPARQILAKQGKKTIFNFLGPLLNPAGANHQLIGCAKSEMMPAMAKAFLSLGGQKAWIVRGDDGMDEITTTNTTTIYEVSKKEQKIEKFTLDPRDFGLNLAKIEDLKGEDVKYNAQKLLELLDGKKSAYRDIVLLNAAAALSILNQEDKIWIEKLDDALKIGAKAIDSGNAKEILEKIKKFSN